MQGNGLVLPSGILPPVRGDVGDERHHQAAASSSPSFASNGYIVDAHFSTSMALIKHEDELAKFANQAYTEPTRLSQFAVIASPSASSSSHTKRSPHSPSSSSMFIKAKPRKPPTRKTDLEALLDRNRNLLKSREVCRLLSVSQLEKLKNDTIQLERKLQAKKEEGLDHIMMGLKVDEDLGSEAADGNLSSQPSLHTTRGKAKMISAKENARLQRVNFEAEQELQRTREYEMMGKQLSRMDLAGRSTRHRNSSNELESDDIDVLGLGGPGLHTIDETDMGVQDSDDW